MIEPLRPRLSRWEHGAPPLLEIGGGGEVRGGMTGITVGGLTGAEGVEGSSIIGAEGVGRSSTMGTAVGEGVTVVGVEGVGRETSGLGRSWTGVLGGAV